MKFSENFTYEELTYSETAIRLGLDNTPNQEQLKNLMDLCQDVLEPLRTIVGAIKINSGFRSVETNASIGGVITSQHCKGQAVDTVALNMTVKDYFYKIKELVESGKLDVDQCIYEFSSWTHISYRKGYNRKQFLIASRKDCKTVYTKI